mmetsp:Transcript_12864/g.12766  ORF Transcript_12864/g.12766 Transcript_12864/m.12766 type:complete len:192 (+) Transcript_12864:508-1083(+)
MLQKKLTKKLMKKETKQSSLLEKREKCLKGIFDFYSRQQLLIGKKATFEEIESKINTLLIGEFLKFCLDFKVPLRKPKLLEIFKKESETHKSIDYAKFKDVLVQIFIEVNKEKVRLLKKKIMQVPGKNNFLMKTLLQEIKNEVTNLKNKKYEQIQAEAYQFLEIDDPKKVEQKKIGMNVPFHIHDKTSQSP